MKKRIISLISLCLGILMLASCGTPAGPGDDTAAVDTTSPVTTEPETTRPPLPEIDLDGFELHLYKLDQEKILWANMTFAIEETTGDIVNDNTFNRNQRLMEQYKFKLKDTSDVNINKMIPTLAQSGDTTYHAYMSRLNQIAPQSLEGMFINLREVKTLFLDEAWWDQGMIRDLEMFGNMFFINGDLSVSNNDCVQVLFYNKQLAKDLGITNLYEMVRDGKWTIDRMAELTGKASADVNGDGTRDHNDRYGLLASSAETVNSLYAGLGGRVALLNQNHIPELKAASELSQTVADKLTSFYSDKNNHYDYARFPKETTMTNREGIVMMFSANNCLFFGNGISASAQYMRDIDVDYGFLPNPKMNEEQENYISKVSYSCPVFVIPQAAKDPDKTGLVWEILSRDSAESVLDDYYNTCFSAKYVRDQESYEMLLIADANHMFDPGNSFDWGKLGTQITKTLWAADGTYSSTVASYAPAAETAIADMVAKFKK